MLFGIFHISLSEKRDLLSEKKVDGSEFNREEWIRQIFTQRIDFMHRTEKYHFMPFNSKMNISETLLIGRIGRHFVSEENAPPEENLDDVLRDTWRAGLVIIDPAKHEDGQRIAMQQRPGVGQPDSVLRSLMHHVSQNIENAPYAMEVRAVTNPSDFWDFVSENRGEITSLTIEFISPNMFGIGDNMDEEFISLKRDEGVTRAKTTIENDDGLKLETDRVRKSVDYASKGGGSISARTKRGKRFSSKNSVQKVTIKENENAQKKSTVVLIKDAIAAIFKK